MRVDPKTGQRFDQCECGCGEWLPRATRTPDKPRKRKQGHQVGMPKRTRAEWSSIYDAFLASTPLCRCGCGERVTPLASTLDRFIRWRGPTAVPEYKRGHARQKVPYNTPISPIIRSAILGTLLGDSSIQYPHATSQYPRLILVHGECQAAWLRFKATYLQPLGATVSLCQNLGYGKAQGFKTIRARTSCLEGLASIYREVVRDGRKTVTRAWLDNLGAIGLAWWLADDGSRSAGRNNLAFHTEGFTRDESVLIADWLQSHYPGTAKLRHYRTYWNVQLNVVMSRHICAIVGPYLPECMRYKLVSG